MANFKLFSDEDKTMLFEGVELSDEGQTDFLIKLEAMIVEKVALKEEEAMKKKAEEDEEKEEAEEEENEKKEEEKEKELEEAKAELEAAMEDNINSYLDYVVESWVEDNEIALEAGVKVEIMENFMTGMKDLFAESYFDIPEDQVDVIAESQAKIDALESSLSDEISQVSKLKESLETLQREKIIAEHSGGLTDSQIEKFETLLEGVEYGSDTVFDKKAKTIRESYFKEKDDIKQPLTEKVEDDSDPMAKYVAHL